MTIVVLRSRWVFVSALLLLVTCKAPPPAPKPAPKGPQVRATVVTIRTTLQPSKKTLTHTIVIAGNLARSSDEVDVWRLYDLKGKTVTYVDEIAKTVRTVPIAMLVAARRGVTPSVSEGPGGPGGTSLSMPGSPRPPSARPLATLGVTARATISATGATKTLLNVPTNESVIKLGAYERHLWIAPRSPIPADLFAMMTISDTSDPPVDALLGVSGFPLLDHAEVAYGKNKMTTEREVVSIEQKDVPASTIAVPRYPAATTPPAHPPPAASPPRGRTAPAAGSPPSATTRTAP